MSAIMPALSQLKVRLARLSHFVNGMSANVYRSSSPRYATETDVLNGRGSQRFGGRWNPIGIAVVYASLTPETAMAETLAHNRYYGIPVEQAMPRIFVAIGVRLRAVLDLRDGRVRQSLKVSLDRMLTVDWRKEVSAGRVPITQILGQAVSEVGLEGLIVPSAADRTGHNLLVFPANIQAGSDIQLLAPHKTNS